jgi:uncharacterized membrane protein YhaH (DUF805 family)
MAPNRGNKLDMLDFFFPKRLHRLSFLLRTILCGVVLCFLESRVGLSNPQIWWAIFIAVQVYEIFFIEVPRIRDIGLSGWWWLIMLVPGPNVVFCLILLFRAPVPAPRPSPAILPPAQVAVPQGL